jgi:hypothetical protein
MKRRLNSGNDCYHSDQNLFSLHLPSKNVKIKIFKIIILSVVLYRCETWSQTLRDLWCLVTGCWGGLLDFRGMKWWEGGENCLESSHKAVLLQVPVFERYINPRFLHLGGSRKRGAFFTPRPFYSKERAFSSHWIRGWVGPKPVWTIFRNDNSWPYWDLNFDPSVIQPVTSGCWMRYPCCSCTSSFLWVIWKYLHVGCELALRNCREQSRRLWCENQFFVCKLPVKLILVVYLLCGP